MIKAIVAAALLIGVCQSANAHWGEVKCEHKEHKKFKDFEASSCINAPEIDPSSAIAGFTLLLGGLAVMRGRRQS